MGEREDNEGGEQRRGIWSEEDVERKNIRKQIRLQFFISTPNLYSENNHLTKLIWKG